MRERAVLKLGLWGKLFLFLLVCGVAATGATAYFSYRQAKITLEDGMVSHLTSIRDIKRKQIELIFKDRLAETETLASIPYLTVNFNKVCALTSKAPALNLVSPNIKALLELFERSALIFKEKLSIYDVLLVNHTGLVVYSIIKEPDLGVNLLKDESLDKELTRSLKLGLEQPTISELTQYSPSGGMLSLFFIAPVKGHDGGVCGALVAQVDTQSVDRIMSERSGLGATGETIIAGSDGYLRSDSRFSTLRGALTQRAGAAMTKVTAEGLEGAAWLEDYRGRRALTAYAPLNIHGLHWSLLAKIDEAELMAPLDKLRTRYLQGAVGLALAVALVSFVIARRHTAPLLALERRLRRMARTGEYGEVMESASGGEVGSLVASFNALSGALAEKTRGLEMELSERRDTQRRLTQSELRYRGLFNSTQEGVVVYRDGGILDANAAVARMFGYDPAPTQPLKGMDLLEFMAPPWRAEMAHRLRIAMELDVGDIGPYEVTGLRKDGEQVELEAVARPFVYEERRALLVLFRDITARKRAEAESRRGEERLRGAFRQAAIGQLVATLDGRFAAVNPALIKTLGYREEELLGMGFADITPPDERCVLEDERLPRLLDGTLESFTAEKRYQARDGETLWGMTHLSLARGGQGEPMVFVAQLQDITAQKRVSLELLGKNRLLDAITHSLSMFIASGPSRKVFEDLLEALISLTGSEFGFIAEYFMDEEARPYLRMMALSNIAWSDQTLELYHKMSQQDFRFYDLDSLQAACVRVGGPVITNDPARSPHSKGLPEGHPPLRSFMGLPIFRRGQIMGCVGVANRPGGYSEELAAFLEPFLTTCGNIYEAMRVERERAQAEATRRNAEERIRLVVEGVGAVIWEYDPSTDCFTFIGGRAEELFGYPVSDWLEPGFWRHHIHGPDRDTAVNFCSAAYRRGEDHSFEYRFLARGGVPIWVRDIVQVMRDGAGAPVGMRGMLIDISARKRAEELVRESEEKYRTLVETAADAIFIADAATGDIVDANRAAEDLTGLPRAKLIGLNQWRLHPPEEQERYQQLFRAYAAMAKGAPIQIEVQRSDNGRRVPVEVTSSSFEISGRRLILGAFRDITERKKAEEDLRRAKDAAEEATRLKDKFVSLVAHDLKSPLASGLGLLRLVTQDRDALPKQRHREMLRHTGENMEYILDMIDGLLDITRLQTGKITPRISRVDASYMTAVAVGSFSHAARAKGVVLRNLVPEGAMVYADPALFGEVLNNLISNAIKFCAEGDTVQIAIPEGRPNVISISDNGPGVSDELLPHLFRHEIRTSTVGTAGERGTGLGLPYSHDIMAAHGGDLTVEKREGGGVAFHAILPETCEACAPGGPC